MGLAIHMGKADSRDTARGGLQSHVRALPRAEHWASSHRAESSGRINLASNGRAMVVVAKHFTSLLIVV